MAERERLNGKEREFLIKLLNQRKSRADMIKKRFGHTVAGPAKQVASHMIRIADQELTTIDGCMRKLK